MKNFWFEEFRRYLDSTDEAKLKEDWREIEHIPYGGPNAFEYIDYLCRYYPAKRVSCLQQEVSIPDNMTPKFSGSSFYKSLSFSQYRFMTEAKKAAFSFKSFEVIKFSFGEPEKLTEDSMRIIFNPSGFFNSKTGLYKIVFEFKAFLKGEEEIDVVKSTIHADFQFTETLSLNEIPTYF